MDNEIVKQEAAPIATASNMSVMTTAQRKDQMRNIATDIYFNDDLYNRCWQMAQTMSQSGLAVPAHLQGEENVGVCMAVQIQALQWGMSPYSVAQKTFNLKGKIGYEAQLVSAVVHAMVDIVEPSFDYEFFGDWDKILSAPGGKWNKADEVGLGCICRATLKGDDKPKETSLLLTQCTTRNSTNWVNDPQQQICYRNTQRWSRRYTPGAIQGVYTRDEMPIESTIPHSVSHSDTKKPSILDTKPAVKEEVIEAKAEVVEEKPQVKQTETITVAQIVAAVGLPKEQILAYHKAVADPKWSVKESLSELTPEVRVYLMQNTAQAKEIVTNFINPQTQPQKINADQLKRLQTIKSVSGKTEVYFKQYLEQIHGLKSSKDITVGEIYDIVCNWLETSPQSPQPTQESELF